MQGGSRRWQLGFAACLVILFSTKFLGLYTFTRGFLTTRRELLNTSSCHDQRSLGFDSSGRACWSEPVFDRAVILVVDALREDFFFDGDAGRASHGHSMPRLRALVQQAVRLLIACSALACVLSMLRGSGRAFPGPYSPSKMNVPTPQATGTPLPFPLQTCRAQRPLPHGLWRTPPPSR